MNIETAFLLLLKLICYYCQLKLSADMLSIEQRRTSQYGPFRGNWNSVYKHICPRVGSKEASKFSILQNTWWHYFKFVDRTTFSANLLLGVYCTIIKKPAWKKPNYFHQAASPTVAIYPSEVAQIAGRNGLSTITWKWLCMYLSIYMYIYIHIYLYLSLSLSPYIHTYIYMYVNIHAYNRWL